MSYKIVKVNPKNRVKDLQYMSTGVHSPRVLEVLNALDVGITSEVKAFEDIDVHWLLIIVDGAEGLRGVLVADKNLPTSKTNALVTVLTGYLSRIFPGIERAADSQSYIETITKTYPTIWHNNNAYAVYKF